MVSTKYLCGNQNRRPTRHVDCATFRERILTISRPTCIPASNDEDFADEGMDVLLSESRFWWEEAPPIIE
jgi:hypothetical protein